MAEAEASFNESFQKRCESALLFTIMVRSRFVRHKELQLALVSALVLALLRKNQA